MLPLKVISYLSMKTRANLFSSNDLHLLNTIRRVTCKKKTTVVDICKIYNVPVIQLFNMHVSIQIQFDY